MTDSPNPWAVALVTVAVVLAGCSAFAPSAGSDEPTATVTPVPVPTDAPGTATETRTPSVGQFPGISPDGVVDGEALFAAHVAYLSNRSFTVSWSRATAGGSGAAAHSFQRFVAVANGTTYLRRNAGERFDETETVYVAGGSGYRRLASGNGTRVTRFTPSMVTKRDSRERFSRFGAFEVVSFIEQGYNDVDVVERDGRTYARIFTQTAPGQLDAIYDSYDVRNFTGTIWVTQEGYVRAVQYRFELRSNIERIAVAWRYAYTRVGATTVTEPEWVSRARANATATPGTATAAPPNGTATP